MAIYWNRLLFAQFAALCFAVAIVGSTAQAQSSTANELLLQSPTSLGHANRKFGGELATLDTVLALARDRAPEVHRRSCRSRA